MKKEELMGKYLPASFTSELVQRKKSLPKSED